MKTFDEVKLFFKGFDKYFGFGIILLILFGAAILIHKLDKNNAVHEIKAKYQAQTDSALKQLQYVQDINSILVKRNIEVEDSLKDQYSYIKLIEDGQTKTQYDKIKALNNILNSAVDTTAVLRSIVNLKKRYNIR